MTMAMTVEASSLIILTHITPLYRSCQPDTPDHRTSEPRIKVGGNTKASLEERRLAILRLQIKRSTMP